MENPVSILAEKIQPETLSLKISGRLDSANTGKAWREVSEILGRTSPKRLIVEAADIDYCDCSGIGLFLEFFRRQREIGGAVEIRGFRPEFQQLLSMFDPADFAYSTEKHPTPTRFPEAVGKATDQFLKDIRSLVAFVGQVTAALVHALFNFRIIRWKEVFHIFETAGVNALPITALISFIMGLILAFQAVIPMRQFGADIYVANLVALSILRELGPLMTAIVLVGRSGSAFAAEIGTMKVNEEIDALTTMGIAPVQFLILPRIIAALAVTPLLTVYADLVGLTGGLVVMTSFGFPPIAYVHQVLTAVTYVDFAGGVFKAFVFGIVVSAMGCFKGLQTTTGASAVGDAATQSVVSGIILIVLIDGMFSIVYYYLGI